MNKISKIQLQTQNIGLYIAFFCIGLGLISTISSNWQAIPDMVKLVSATLILGATAWGIFTYREKKPFLSEALVIFDAVFIMASIGLFIQIYQLQIALHQYLLIWCLLTLPLLLISRKSIVALVWIPLLGTSVASYISLIPWLQNLFSYLSQTPILWTVTFNSFGIIVFLLMQHFVGTKLASILRAFKFWIIFDLIVGVIQVDIMSNFQILREFLSFYIPENFNFAVAYGIAGFWILALSVLSYKLQKGRLFAAILLLTYFYSAISPLLANWPSALPGFIYCLAVLLTMGIAGYKTGRLRMINNAAVLAAIRIFIGYIQVFGSLLTTGIGLIASGGIILIFIYGIKFLKKFTKSVLETSHEK